MDRSACFETKFTAFERLHKAAQIKPPEGTPAVLRSIYLGAPAEPSNKPRPRAEATGPDRTVP